MQAKPFHCFDEGFRTLLESLPDAKVLVNAAQCIMFINSRAEHLLGFERNELIGCPVAQFISPRFRSHHKNLIASCLDGASPQSAFEWDVRAVRKDGNEFPAEIAIGRLETDHGPIVVLSVRDVTSRKVAEEQFRRLLETAPDAQRRTPVGKASLPAGRRRFLIPAATVCAERPTFPT